MLHLGPRTFDELSGEVVQNTAFIIHKEKPKRQSVYHRLVAGKNCVAKCQMFFSNINRFIVEKQDQFAQIPGAPIAYWVGEKTLTKLFRGKSPLDIDYFFREGIHTANNNKFTRFWFEPNFLKLVFGASSYQDIDRRGTWVPYNKGGGSRKWFGLSEVVIGFDEKCRSEMNDLPGHVRPSESLYFKEGATWSSISSKEFALRYYPKGYLFDAGGQVAVPRTSGSLKGLLAYLNSTVFRYVSKTVMPTINNKCGIIKTLPNLVLTDSEVISTVTDCISISKLDWDAHETSWDFQTNELVRMKALKRGESDCHLSEVVEFYKSYWEEKFYTLQRNEKEINRVFIDIYDLKDELTPDVPFEEITILQQGEISIEQEKTTAEEEKEIPPNSGMVLNIAKLQKSAIKWHDDVIIKQLISYCVGLMMGRYRLDKAGLFIAHPNETLEEIAEYTIPGTAEKFSIDKDAIIPLLPEDSGFHDNAVRRFATMIRQIFGEKTQTENLNYIESCLGKSLEQYFIKDFWKDHKKMYQNRPIYWLFASCKGAFQVLVYVHRMNIATVEHIRSRHLLPYIERLNKRIDDLQADESTLSTKQRAQLKNLHAQVEECTEYYNRLVLIAERGIVPDLDAGIPANHALYGDIVTKLR